ncbi:MAG: hypothetical protein U0L79_01985 [Lachnospiraceae bacterium]|nr:hypothetical protein [Lachnospiraceae bacterium]
MKKIFIKKSFNIFNIILFLLILSSSMVVLVIDGKSLFLYVSVLYIFFGIVYAKKFKLIDDVSVYLVFFIYMLSMVTCVFSNIAYSYKYACVRATIIMMLVFAVLHFVNYHIYSKDNVGEIIVKAVKIMCAMHIFWSLLAFFAFKLFGWDLNQKIFADILGLLESASQYKEGVLQPSGLSWHSSTLAPILTLSYFLFDRIEMKLLSVVVAVICGNATALIGICICVFFDISYTVIKRKPLSKKIMKLLVILLIIAILSLVLTGYYKNIIDKVVYILQRMSGNSDDSSAYAHIRYYWSYPQVVKLSSTFQVLFGYGKGCSGFPIGELFGQYRHLGNWSVESDIMDILISEGIVGFVIFYYFLFKIINKGRKIDIRYSFVVIVWILEGITYNIQFEWFIFIEVVFLLLIKKGYNIFQKNN